jgi:hypothetical protein
MTISTAIKRVLARFRAILAQWPLRIILRIWDVFKRNWMAIFGYRKRRPFTHAMWEPGNHSTLGKGSCSGINILASRIPWNSISFSREHPREYHETELLPLPVVSGRPLPGASGMIRSTSGSLALPVAGIANYASRTSLDLTSTHHPYRQSSINAISRSTPNLTRTAPESRAHLEGDPVPDSHTFGMPPSPLSSQPHSRNGRPNSVPVIVVSTQEGNIGGHAASSSTVNPDYEASQHNPGDNQDIIAGYNVSGVDLANPCPSQHRTSPATVSCT